MCENDVYGRGVEMHAGKGTAEQAGWWWCVQVPGYAHELGVAGVMGKPIKSRTYNQVRSSIPPLIVKPQMIRAVMLIIRTSTAVHRVLALAPGCRAVPTSDVVLVVGGHAHTLTDTHATAAASDPGAAQLVVGDRFLG